MHDFSLPTYDELPVMGLYLKQVVAYINESLRDLPNVHLTSSMVSNYVKHGLINGPKNKLYDRDQIAILLFIAVAKKTLDQKNLRRAIGIQHDTYDTAVAYNYFADELQNVLEYVFDESDHLQDVGHDHTKQKQMLRNIIKAFAYQEYLYFYFINL